MKKLIIVYGLLSNFALTAACKEGETKAASEKAIVFKLKNKLSEDIYYMHSQSFFTIGQKSEHLLKKDGTDTVMLTALPKIDMYYTLRLYPASALTTETAEQQEALRTDYNIPEQVLEAMASKTFEIKPQDGHAVIPDLDALLQKINLTPTSLIDAEVKKEMRPYFE